MSDTTITDAEPPPKKAKPPAHERWGTLYARGSPTDELSDADLAAGLRAALDKIGARERVLLLPPDITRLMSKAGELAAYEALSLEKITCTVAVLPRRFLTRLR